MEKFTMETLGEVINSNTTEEGINLKGVWDSINAEYVDKTVKPSWQTKYENEVATKIGNSIYEGIHESVKDKETFDVYVKQITGNTDLTKEELLTLKTQFTDLENKYKEKSSQLDTISPEVQSLRNQREILSKGITDMDQVEFIEFKVSKMVTEEKDFNTCLNEYLGNQNPITTGKPVNNLNSQATKPRWEQILEEKNPNIKW